MSTKIYPTKEIEAVDGRTAGMATTWTVWKKSSMSFVGSDGFTVYDGEGRVAFRVDNYERRNKFFVGELLLMDAVGTPLLFLKPQIVSMHDQWKGYRATSDDRSSSKTDNSKSHLFTMRKRSSLLAEAFMSAFGGNCNGSGAAADFRIEGNFKKRCCEIRAREGQVMAVISPKKACSPSAVLGEDVFGVVVEGGLSPELVMAFIVVLDRFS